MLKRNLVRTGRRVAAVLAAVVLPFAGITPAVSAAAAAGAGATTVVPAYGVITITDDGLGPRATWTYDGVLDCTFTTQGPGGVPAQATVVCSRGQEISVAELNCPLMIVSRTTATVVGARASCDRTLDMGVGTSGAASANLGNVTYSIVCEAYVDAGVLVPPYTVTCNEPGLPTLTSPLTSLGAR
jgi:hypothetical protein